MAHVGSSIYIDKEATKIASMTGGDKDATMKIMKEYSPVAMKISNLASPVINGYVSTIGKLANEEFSPQIASEYYINEACDKEFDNLSRKASKYEKEMKVKTVRLIYLIL